MNDDVCKSCNYTREQLKDYEFSLCSICKQWLCNDEQTTYCAGLHVSCLVCDRFVCVDCSTRSICTDCCKGMCSHCSTGILQGEEHNHVPTTCSNCPSLWCRSVMYKCDDCDQLLCAQCRVYGSLCHTCDFNSEGVDCTTCDKSNKEQKSILYRECFSCKGSFCDKCQVCKPCSVLRKDVEQFLKRQRYVIAKILSEKGHNVDRQFNATKDLSSIHVHWFAEDAWLDIHVSNHNLHSAQFVYGAKHVWRMLSDAERTFRENRFNRITSDSPGYYQSMLHKPIHIFPVVSASSHYIPPQ